MKKISLENVAYHLIPSVTVFLIYSLMHLLLKTVSPLIIALLMLLQVAMMQFIMNANTMAKRPYMTVSNITGYVKPKKTGTFILNVILLTGVIVVLHLLVYRQMGTFLMQGAMSQLPGLFLYTPVVHTGILGAYIVPAVTAIVWGVLLPLYEGIYFRGFLLFDLRKSKWLGVGVSTLLYALTHTMTLHYLPYYLLLGCLLSCHTYLTKNLYMGIAAHWLAYGIVGGLAFFHIL